MMRLDWADLKYKPPKEFIEKLQKSIKNINEYPSGDYNKLKRRLADYCNVKKENILVTNGSDEAIDLVTRAFGKSVLIPIPTFSQYELAAKRQKSQILYKNCIKNNKYVLNYKKRDLKKPSLVWVCNPNNPTGTLINKNKIIEVIKNSIGIVAIDECYYEFSNQTIIGKINEYSNLIIVRSLSKGFGIAGLRIGYIISNKKIISKLEKIRQIFNVNLLAEKAGLLIFNYIDYYKKRITELKNIKKDFIKFLNKNDIKVFDSYTNFILIDFKKLSFAKYIYDELKKRQIYTFLAWDEEFSGLNGPYLRVTIGTKKQMDLVKRELSMIFQKLYKQQKIGNY